MAKVRDMTQGSPVKHIIAFAVPMLLGNMFQQMYSLVDTAVVGKIVGVEALAAVGAAGWLDWLVLGFVIGLTQGFSILISQRFGAGDHSGMRRAVAMSGYLTMAAEAAEQLGDTVPTHVFLQAGVGAMAGGVMDYLLERYSNTPPMVVLVEPEAAACVLLRLSNPSQPSDRWWDKCRKRSNTGRRRG